MIGDVKFVKGAGPTMTFNSEDWTAGAGTTTKQPGDVVKRGDTGGNFATIVLDGDIELGVDIGLGIVRKASTETNTVDGVVEVRTFSPGSIIRAKATTPANIDTAAEFLALALDCVTFDRSAADETGILTIDENEGDDPNVHALMMLSADYVRGLIDAAVNINGTMFGSLQGQTMD